MDDVQELRKQYHSLRKRLDKQQNILNSYLKGRVPVSNRSDPSAHDHRERHRRRTNEAEDASQWTSTPLRRTRSPTKHSHHSRHKQRAPKTMKSSKQRSFDTSQTRVTNVATPNKRKSDADTPRQVGRGSNLMHHGSESKRLRSMEENRPRPQTQRVHSSPHSSYSAEERSFRSRKIPSRHRSPYSVSAADSRMPSSNRSFSSTSGLGRYGGGEQDENMAEGNYVEHLLSPGNSRYATAQARDVTPQPRSILMTPGGKPKKTPLRVNFLEQLNRGHRNSPIRPLPRTRPSPHHATPTASFQGSLHERSYGNVTQPLLGYDWIAGLLDNDAVREDTSNGYLEEIRQFRQLNRDECVHTSVLDDAEEMHQSHISHDVDDPRTQAQGHKCIHNYVMNDRLFAVPLHGNNAGESLCAICQARRTSELKRATSPSYVRVSIPRSTLMSPYRIHPHRRQSFDPTDSMGLSQHCLAGWQNSRPSMMPPASTIDLKASLDRTMVAASTMFDPTMSEIRDTTAGRPLGPSQHTQELLNRSHAMRVDLQRLERAGLSMGASQGAARNYPLL